MTSSKEVVKVLNNRLIDQVWFATFIIGMIALPLSVFRLTITGWQHVYLDLNRFKQVNDAHGHRAGGHVLVEVANRLRDNLRGDDTVARLGGDEFLLVLNDVEHAQFAQAFVKKLAQIVGEPIVWQDHDVSVGVSVGVAYYPDDGDVCETLIELADQSMYVDKSSRVKTSIVTATPLSH